MHQTGNQHPYEGGGVSGIMASKEATLSITTTATLSVESTPCDDTCIGYCPGCGGDY